METNKSSLKGNVQRLGSFLSGMVLPNIGAFIAWGLITALFIPTGWMPNEYLGKLVGPMITFLLPLLIGFTGGKMVYGHRGGVVGAIATAGVIIGASIPMFLGAMIMGPVGGYVIKKFDKLVEDKVPTGFEMLVNNFSAGIIGGIVAILAYTCIEPVVSTFSNTLGSLATIVTNLGLLPLIDIFIEPAKILFLNNAINHGILTPLGVQQAADAGKSIFFLLEANPGPGLGILLAYSLYGKGNAKQSAPGAIIIHFLGGIHEIYFPYILMKPILILAAIAGGISADLVFVLTHAGLRAASSPGSIFAILAMTASDSYVGVIGGVAVGAIVSFLVGSLILKASKDNAEEENFDDAQAKIKDMKAESKGAKVEEAKVSLSKTDVKMIVFACDAGMGSSAMGESILKKALKDAGITGIDVKHSSVDSIPQEANVVFTQENLIERARSSANNAASIITIKNFLDRSKYDEFINTLK
jgi:PTS system mannitol-specific IIC component